MFSFRLSFGLLAIGLGSLSPPALAQSPLDGLTEEGWRSFRASARSSGYQACVVAAKKQTTNEVLVTSYCGCVADALSLMPEATIKEHYGVMVNNQEPTGGLKTLLDRHAADCMRVAVQSFKTTR